MAKLAAPPGWDARVRSATTIDELDALYQEAVRGGFNDRARYVLVQKNQATIGQVNEALKATAQKALAPLPGLTQEGAGNLLRQTVPGLVDQFGNVNAQIAKAYYETQRDLAFSAIRQSGNYVRKGQVKAANRRAAATLQGQVYKAGIPDFNVAEKTDSIIGYGMKSFMDYGGAQASANVENAMTRAVASYNRDTMLYNSSLDPAVIGVQRVAEADACAFCQMVAFDSYGSARVSGYAADYHNHCRCSIETLYAGDTAYRPDYYDDFQYGGLEDLSTMSTADTKAFFNENPDAIPTYLQNNADFLAWIQR